MQGRENSASFLKRENHTRVNQNHGGGGVFQVERAEL